MLSRMAERNKKRRMPGTHDWYLFGAEVMAQPLKRARTARDVVDELPAAAVADDTQPPPAAPRRRRAKRKRTIIEVAPGDEATGRETKRRVEERCEVPGMFSASKFHWLFFAPPSVTTTQPFQ